jgi:hypothetical protein
MVPRFFQMRFLGGSGREFCGFLDLNLGKPAVFVGAGHWLHDTPPIFSNQIMRFLKHRSCTQKKAGLSTGLQLTRLVRSDAADFNRQL